MENQLQLPPLQPKLPAQFGYGFLNFLRNNGIFVISIAAINNPSSVKFSLWNPLGGPTNFQMIPHKTKYGEWLPSILIPPHFMISLFYFISYCVRGRLSRGLLQHGGGNARRHSDHEDKIGLHEKAHRRFAPSNG